jgi:hypothetical protein
VNTTVDTAKEAPSSPRTSIPQATRQDDTLADQPNTAATDKQKRMLEDSDPGHFSMIRAMHLADLITLLNGQYSSSLQLAVQ